MFCIMCDFRIQQCNLAEFSSIRKSQYIFIRKYKDNMHESVKRIVKWATIHRNPLPFIFYLSAKALASADEFIFSIEQMPRHFHVDENCLVYSAVAGVNLN